MLDHYQRNYEEKEAVYQEAVKRLQESWGQYQRIQSFYQKELQELGNERATLTSRASAIEAAQSVREQERQAQLKVRSAITKKRLEETYADAFAKLRDECAFQTQQCGALQQQLQQVQL